MKSDSAMGEGACQSPRGLTLPPQRHHRTTLSLGEGWGEGRLILIALLLLTAPLHALDHWTAPVMSRIMRDTPPSAWQPDLSAARGEWEAFQFVLTGKAEELLGTTLTATSLHDGEDHIITAPLVLREHYVAITQPSERSTAPAGDYPDALVPQSFPWQELPSRGSINQPFWVDVYVPPNTPAGLYRGSVEAVLTTGRKVSVPYTVKVWDFDLPKVPRFKTSWFIVWRRIAKVHGFDHEKDVRNPALHSLMHAYYDLLADHRISPHESFHAYPDPDEPISEKSYEAIETALKHHLIRRGAGSVGLPLWVTWPFNDPLHKDREAALDYCARYFAICEKLGCADRLYKIFGELDEPHTPAMYEDVKVWSRFFKELQATRKVRIPLLITEEMTPPEKELGTLIGYPDIWSMHVGDIWMDMEAAKAPKLMKQRQAAGDVFWAYTALVQTPNEWAEKHGTPWPQKLTTGNPPVWLTDYAPMHHRVLPWMSLYHDVKGFTYWDSSMWPDGHDVWKNNGTYPHANKEQYNGDGFFIYPARKAVHGREGPVASIRLKWIRESLEDYDYLSLLAERGFKHSALDEASAFVRGFGDWDNQPETLMLARHALGEMLSKLSRVRAIAR